MLSDCYLSAAPHEEESLMQTPKYILEKIIQAKEQGSKELDLSASWGEEERLTRIPDEVYEFKDLAELNLSGHDLALTDDAFSRLPGLTLLNLSNNKLASLPESLFQLRQLESLNL